VPVRPHLSIAGAFRRRVTKPDPSLLQGAVAAEVLAAMKIASAALRASRIRHVVVGALAVGANGFPRATEDVNFLVGDEAFERHAGGLVTLRAGVPFEVNGVAVDFVRAQPEEDFLTATLDAEPGSMIDARAARLHETEVAPPQGSHRRDRARQEWTRRGRLPAIPGAACTSIRRRFREGRRSSAGRRGVNTSK